MTKIRNHIVVPIALSIMLIISSWNNGLDSVVGPIPQRPSYDNPSMWYIQSRGGEADLFYIISTETGDHMMGGDTCHLADIYNMELRKPMQKEMTAVDSFYSDKLNYFSPYYRQVSMDSWADSEKAFARLPITVSDVKRSWQYYLEHFNQGRPFIIAGFSQGALAALEIVKHMPDSVMKRMVAAYVIGYKVGQEDLDSFPNIRLAQGATDTGVTISFNSVKSPESILYISKNTKACINPVNWRTDSVRTQFVLYGRKKNDTLSVHCDPKSRHIIVEGYQQKNIMPIIGCKGNYHDMELKFYYPYIRRNMADRVAAFMKRE